MTTDPTINQGISLPYPFLAGEYPADSFQDHVQQNMTALARAIGVAARMRLVHGLVGSDGTTVTGLGFTSSRTGTGAYTVTFDIAFSAAPTVAGACTSLAAVMAPLALPGSITVATSVSGSATDSAFYFVALL